MNDKSHIQGKFDELLFILKGDIKSSNEFVDFIKFIIDDLDYYEINDIKNYLLNSKNNYYNRYRQDNNDGGSYKNNRYNSNTYNRYYQTPPYESYDDNRRYRDYQPTQNSFK